MYLTKDMINTPKNEKKNFFLRRERLNGKRDRKKKTKQDILN